MMMTVLWRKNYWDNFYRNTTSKTKDWKYEQEWRLVLEDRWLDEGEDPKLIYDFNSLKGRFLAVKPPTKTYSELVKIIRKKVRDFHGRTDFKF